MAPFSIVKERRAETFARIEACAVAGERCPTKDQGVRTEDVAALAHAGKISVEISTHNWRRITILEGVNKGKSTAANPLKRSSVYLTIDTSGTRRADGGLESVKAMGVDKRAPSKPSIRAYAGKYGV